MAADVAPRPYTPQPAGSRQSMASDDFIISELSTLPDPRSRTLSPVLPDGTASPLHHPELSDEVATLSTKLINAINHQTNLDDTLSATRADLDQARDRIRQLEDQVAQQREMLAGDVWVRRKSVDAEKSKLLSRLAEEKRSRIAVEEQKKKIEGELESLTAALFEEANKMVVTAKEEAKQDYEALQKRNDQLKGQLADTEGLLRSQQDQLAELKHVMEQMNAERDEQQAITAPSSPGFSKFETTDDGVASDRGPPSALTEPLSPSYPTSFTQLVQTVLRTDLSSYEDFTTLIRTSKRLSTSANNRISSGSHSGLSSLALALGAAQPTSAAPSNGSTTSLTNHGTTAPSGSPQTPGTPSSSSGAPGASATTSINLPALPALKDTKFYKRVLAEDIEPTLRLDIAPGLSWLARRAVLNAMADGSLVVEPVPTSGPVAHTARPPCSLCGETRRDEPHRRSHRFRTSETDSAQRYPLCRYCLARVRSTCDFLGFLRIVRDGHWRADDDDAEKAAWEESVRLREQMFWSRMGGGVVPTGSGGGHHHHSNSMTAQQHRVGGTPGGGGSPRLSGEEEAVVASGAAAPPSKTALSPPDVQGAATTDAVGGAGSAAHEDSGVPPGGSEEAKSGQQRNSTHSLSSVSGAALEGVKRLSLTIPGSRD